jgi:hypothetical protein
MGCRKVRMAVGEWSQKLRDDTPARITDYLAMDTQAFGHVLYLPTRIDPTVFTAADLYALSIFTGVLYERTNRVEIGGHHAALWLGDPNGAGPTHNEITSYTRTFKQWLQAALTTVLSVTEGSIANLYTGTTMQWVPEYWMPVVAANKVCDYYSGSAGAPHEWRVNDNLTFDAGRLSDLYTTTPTVVLTPEFEGREPHLVGMRADLSVHDDVEDYARSVIEKWSDGTYTNADTARASVYVSSTGVAVGGRRIVVSGTEKPVANPANIPAGEVARRDTFTRRVTAKTDQFAVLTSVAPGDNVYAYDSDSDVVDFANEVAYRGRLLWPQIKRVVSIDMPFEAGMGLVYVRGTDTPVDLTPWVIPESPGASLDLGATQRNYVS